MLGVRRSEFGVYGFLALPLRLRVLKIYPSQRRRFLLSVDLLAMTEADHLYPKPITLNLIDDAVTV
jgi:hypothetical protein